MAEEECIIVSSALALTHNSLGSPFELFSSQISTAVLFPKLTITYYTIPYSVINHKRQILNGYLD